MSALPLLVARVLADHPDPAAPADDATFLAHLLRGRTNLHAFLLVGPASPVDRRHVDYVSFSVSSDGPAVGATHGTPLPRGRRVELGGSWTTFAYANDRKPDCHGTTSPPTRAKRARPGSTLASVAFLATARRA